MVNRFQSSRQSVFTTEVKILRLDSNFHENEIELSIPYQ